MMALVLLMQVALPQALLPWPFLLPAGTSGWVGLVVSGILLCFGVWFAARAVAGKTLSPVEMSDIANPFGSGHFLVAHGGSNTLLNSHLKTLVASVERFRPWHRQSCAVDFFGLGRWGLRARGRRRADPRPMRSSAIFHAEVRAPCAGVVVAAEGGMPDFDVPNEDTVNRMGNHLILRCGNAEIVLAHMRQGSIPLSPGDAVALGDRLGEVGNSGASTEPHLHIHAQRPAPERAPPISGAPLALRIDGWFLVRGNLLDRVSG
ncbi:M23 family metallopeptidase [Salibaculum sp.]|uniref:M23 family metallopeptidase n=1 Tax=Salibaculum sp. TaxID=2855480 RepID=UPI002B47C800|nr:M23 family metallopeptidase [Salibaculum sp.]HKL69405.1 M23 family metallopeptidase [Salibaculum sp.]